MHAHSIDHEASAHSDTSRIARIVVGIDFSLLSERALARAMTMAKQMGASVVVCHVLPVAVPVIDGTAFGMLTPALDTHEISEAARKTIDDILARHATEGVPMTSVVRRGDAATEIAAVARETDGDLVVVGTQARSGVSRLLLGDVAQAVVRSTNLPVLMLHDPLAEVS